jgi:hypothetical protein
MTSSLWLLTLTSGTLPHGRHTFRLAEHRCPEFRRSPIRDIAGRVFDQGSIWGTHPCDQLRERLCGQDMDRPPHLGVAQSH